MGEKKKNRSKTRRFYSNMFITAGLLLVTVPIVIYYLNSSRNDSIIDDFLRNSREALEEIRSLEWEETGHFYIPEILTAPGSNPGSSDNDIHGESASSSENGENGGNASGNQVTAPPGTKKPLMSKEEIERRMTGVLIIEKIKLRMIIMDGADEETLRVAAGRIPGTGKLDEVGNCVLAGHRNYTFGKYFNRLDELEAGDEIIIQLPNKTLRYTVYEKKIVEPDDTSIAEHNGTDKILTLYTCHPVAIASHRLVVHARQVE